jgi:hypothetical protein
MGRGFVVAYERSFRRGRGLSAFPTCSSVRWIFRFAVRTSHVSAWVLSELPPGVVLPSDLNRAACNRTISDVVILVYSEFRCCVMLRRLAYTRHQRNLNKLYFNRFTIT